MGERKEKLGGYLKVSYGLADLGFIFMVTMSNTYLLMFYTDVAGITAAAAGTLMMVGRIIDSCSPPVIGAVIEKSHMKWGKYRSWLMIGAPLIFITNALMFLNNSITMPAKAVLACIVYAVFCISTNIAYTGYTSMNSSLTNDQKERVQLSTFRGQGNALGKCLAGFLLIPMITILGGEKEMNARGFFLASLAAGLMCVLLYGNLAWASKGKDIQSIPGNTGAKDSLKVGEMLGLVFKNKNLMLLFLTDVARILSMLVMYAMFPYFFKYVVHDINGAAPFFGIVNILAFVGATSVPLVTRYLSKRNAYITGNLTCGGDDLGCFIQQQRHGYHCPYLYGIYRLFLGKCGEHIYVCRYCGLRRVEDRKKCQRFVLLHVPALHQDSSSVQHRHCRFWVVHGWICGEHRADAAGRPRNPCHFHGASCRTFDLGGSAAYVL